MIRLRQLQTLTYVWSGRRMGAASEPFGSGSRAARVLGRVAEVSSGAPMAPNIGRPHEES